MAYLVQDDAEGCVFCQKIDEDNDRENLILFRGQTACVMLNLYPYNTGHVMIIPNEHIATLEDLSAETSMELLRLLQESLTILRKVLRPDGFNIGANIGKAAGAGIDGHMHLHIVPRWEGDTNFMPILAETRVMPEQLLDTFDKLQKQFDRLDPAGRENQ
jgi:ATP adenylyltransferase